MTGRYVDFLGIRVDTDTHRCRVVSFGIKNFDIQQMHITEISFETESLEFKIEKNDHQKLQDRMAYVNYSSLCLFSHDQWFSEWF